MSTRKVKLPTIDMPQVNDKPRKPSFAEKQLEEQNRQLREEMARLQVELDALSTANARGQEIAQAQPAPEPRSKQWEFGMQEREFGRLEGKADAYAMVINDLLVVLQKVLRVTIDGAGCE